MFAQAMYLSTSDNQSQLSREYGQVVEAQGLKSGKPKLKSSSYHCVDLFQEVSGSSYSLAALVHSQLVCLLPHGILNLFNSIVVFCCYNL